ncbi:MAG: metallophosphoesterase family protein [Armatimonadota bacterium]
MVRFLHTADLQLGMKAKDASSAAQRLRASRFNTLEAIVTLAVHEKVDFILIAGDLFEDNQVNANTVSRAVQILQRADPTPVLILPGNHDPLDSGSVYNRQDFAEGHTHNLHVLRKSEPLVLDCGCILYPCPITQRWSIAEQTAWIPVRDDDSEVIRIGIAHGGVLIMRQDFDHPINPDVCTEKGLDYLALGDWHGAVIYPEQKMAYPGTPEQTSFGEERTGEVLLVTLAGPGETPVTEPRTVHTLRWLDWTYPITGQAEATIEQLKKEIGNIPDGPDVLIRLTLTGEIPSDELLLINEFTTWLQARCENGDLLYAECISQVHSTEAIAGALRDLTDRDPALAGVLADLQRLADETGDYANECAGQTPRSFTDLLNSWNQTAPPAQSQRPTVAEEAIALLARLSMEVR